LTLTVIAGCPILVVPILERQGGVTAGPHPVRDRTADKDGAPGVDKDGDAGWTM